MPKRIDSAERARRMLQLLPLLRRGGPLSLARLATAVGCSPAEVAADLATLTMCGVPPFTPFDMIDLDIQDDQVTVYLEPPGIDRPLRLTAPEARALVAALEAIGYAEDDPLLVKLLGAASPGADVETIERTVRASAAPSGVAGIYQTLAAAIEQHAVVQLDYLTGATGRRTSRLVHPWALVNRLGVWYLVAYCEHAGEERVFRLDRIRSAEPTGTRFEPPEHVTLEVAPRTDALPVAEVRIRAEARPPDERTWPDAAVSQDADGSFLVRIPYQSPAWVARRVVARLGDAVVVAPPSVRQAVRELAAALMTDLNAASPPAPEA